MVKVMCDCCGKECTINDVYKLPRIKDTYTTDKTGTAKLVMCKSIELCENNLCEECKSKLASTLEYLPFINMVGIADGKRTVTWSV